MSELSYYDGFLLIVALAHSQAENIAVSHELFHRKQLVHKVTGTLCYFKCFYAHFFIEHIKGHHKNVAKFEDPATARKNESLYAFVPRSIVGSIKSVWSYESERLVKAKRSAFSFENRMISFSVLEAVYLGLIYLIGGPLCAAI